MRRRVSRTAIQRAEKLSGVNAAPDGCGVCRQIRWLNAGEQDDRPRVCPRCGADSHAVGGIRSITIHCVGRDDGEILESHAGTPGA